jgi:hypothetical protein
VTEFETEQTRPLALFPIRDAATPAFALSLDFFSTPGFLDVNVVDMAGAPVNLAIGQGFALSLLIRDS